jgi:hypothetical protein
MKRIWVLGAVLCAVSASFAHKIRVDFDHGVDFSRYKTYSWTHPAGTPSADALFPNQLMQERIASFVDQAVVCRGVKRVPSGGDLLVSYRISITAVPHYVTFYDGGPVGWGWGDGWGWPGGFSTTTVQTIYEGTLIVDIVDARQKRLVFEGTSVHTISSSPERNTKKLDKAVHEVFEKYPPQPHGAD